nr:hypothetical protein [Tanacetum cinerariifolium]
MTANRVIEMEDPAATTDSSGVPSTIKRSPLNFANEAGASDQGAAAPEVSPLEDVPAASAPEVGQAEEVAATDSSAATESSKRGRDRADVNAPAKVLRRDYADPRPTGSIRGEKSLAAMELGMASTRPAPVPKVLPSSQGTAAVGDPKSENASFASAIGSQESIYWPEWGVAKGSMLDTPEACQDLVDHVAPLGGNGVAAATEVRTRGQVAEEVRCSSGSPGQKNPSPIARDKKPGSTVATLREQVSGEEKLKAAFEEFKRYEDNRVEQRCAEMDARLDALGIDFDEELYPHMLTAIAGRRRFADVVSAGIAKGMSEGLRHGVVHGQAQLSLESIEAYDLEAKAKYVAALQALKDLKYPLVDQLEGLKDAPMDVIMAALYLESDTGYDAPQHVRDLCPSSSQLTIPVYPEVRDPMNPWACKEEMLLADAIAANISRAKKKKKCRIVCRTHGVGSAHQAQSDGVPVSVPTVVPQGLALFLADAATHAEFKEDT